MLFSEIINGRYRAFARMKDEEKARNIGVVKYIEVLASMAGVNIMSWDCKALFGTGTGNKLVDDKNEINRLFFMEVERVAAATVKTDGPSVTFTDEIKQQIKTAQSRHLASKIADAQRRADDHIRQANEYYNRHAEYMKAAGEQFLTIGRLSGTEVDVEAQVQTVINGSLWDFLGVENNHLIFVNRVDVALSYKNLTAGIDMTVNFGRYKAIFDIVNFELRVKPFERNILSRGYYHPHVSNNSSICWGSAQNTAIAELSRFHLLEPMNLLTTILGSYNPNSPYQPLERFHEMVGAPDEIVAREELDMSRNETENSWAQVDDQDVDWGAATTAVTADAAAIGPMGWTQLNTTVTSA